MLVIQGRNVNDCWHEAKQVMKEHGVPRESRNGPVLEVAEPVTVQYFAPCERVLFDPIRDCNPFFHSMEALWMLAGRNDVAWISQFAPKRFANYSDDGATFHAAYGHRWRSFFDMGNGFTDQLSKVIATLIDDPTSRRAVVGMWSPSVDCYSPEDIKLRDGKVPKDLPCNCTIFFKIRDGFLQMTVANRSNDLVWGMMGANVVHMSMLQEYMAQMIGVKVGSYHQIADSFHAYLSTWSLQNLDENETTGDPYTNGSKTWSYPMVTHPAAFDFDLLTFMDGPILAENNYLNPFFPEIACPMRNAWFAYKEKDFKKAYRSLNRMPDSVDWQVAAREWLERREKKNDGKTI